MSQVQDNFTVCDMCGGAIPSAADRIDGISGMVTVSGSGTTLSNKDFCSTAHLVSWFQNQIVTVATPSPAYQPPPTP